MSTILKDKKKKKITIKEIAELAGVAKSTVSEVINNNRKSRVSAKTFAKVKCIIDKYNYVPQISAKALSSHRTYQIGYLVSSKVTLGLANAYFSTIEAGVNKACQEYGYQMLVSTYDLSTIKNFVMPQKLMQRSVDALVIAGLVSEEVMIQLKSLNIPYIIAGGEYDEDVLCLRADMRSTYLKMLKYFADLGHELIGFGSSNQIATKSFVQAFKNRQDKKLKAIFATQAEANEFETGVKHAQNWLKADKSEKYTVFMANDQICIGFLSELLKNNVKCPDEISIMACSDTTSCKWNSLPVSAAESLLEEHGFMACELLVELLENKKSISEVKATLLKEHRPHELIIRATTGKAPELK